MKTNLFILALFVFQYSQAQDTLLVYFKDKGNSDYIELSEKAMERRKKNNVQFDERDKLVNEEYINLMRSEGMVKNVSRWLNGLTLITNSTEQELLANYDFIRKITISKSVTPLKHFNKFDVGGETKSAVYGAAKGQIQQIDLDCLHDMGYNGDGILIAIIDAGFIGMDTIQYFDSVYIENRIVDFHNFVSNSTDVYTGSNHGTMVSSCIVGEKSAPDSLSATAVNVDIALYLTENAATETIIEEFDLVLGLERADSIGADIATISLGYVDFDDSTQNHSFSDMDGVTTIAAIGVNAASSKGILVLCAAGNSGPDPIGTPCDADSCLCIGAVRTDGMYANFSSVGPSADGQVKPDVMARGKNAAVVTDSGVIVLGNGTSFSTPIMAGAMACLMQANPQSSVEVLKMVIRQSGSLFTSPNDSMGYGIPSMCVANDSLIAITQSLNQINTDLFSVYPNPTNGIFVIEGFKNSTEAEDIEIVNILGEQINMSNTQYFNGRLIIDISLVSSGIYILRIGKNSEAMISKRIVKK